MPSKVQLYAQMADRTAEQITGSYQKWTAFLTTAARLYKYPYNEQLMIFAQRPEATACAEYDLWNKQMRRYVRRGSKASPLWIPAATNPNSDMYSMFPIPAAARTLAALTFGNTGRSIVRWYLRRWSSALSFPVKTDLPISWSVWRRSL